MRKPSPSASILILDDDQDVRCAARMLLRRHYGDVSELHDPRRLMSEIATRPPALLLLDLNFTSGRADGREGLELLRQLSQCPNAPAVIVLTAYADVALAVEAVKLGAFDFITKPWDNAKLVATVGAALARTSQPATAPSGALLGESAGMIALRQQIAAVAPTQANVLILGESGVGKELVARAIHQSSERTDAPMLVVDMGAIPETTFETEFFGHRKGSFTDASAHRAGRFQAARGGTLFLDEIGNMSLSSQAKLLTALERRELTPLGADLPEPIDVRVLSATNLDERRLFDPTVFRPDLLYRLNTVVLRVPPLRDRRDDVILLTEHYLSQYARQYGKPLKPLSSEARNALLKHNWPGNVRALRNACERAVILSRDDRLDLTDFALVADGSMPPQEVHPYKLDEREREAIASTLHRVDGNISRAAKLLGVSRGALYRKLEKHGL